MFTRKFAEINLLCFYSNIYNKRIHTNNIFTQIIFSHKRIYCVISGLPVNQSRYQQETTKWTVLRIKIAASPKIDLTQS